MKSICADTSPKGRRCQLVDGHDGEHLARVDGDDLERWGEPLPEPEPFVPPELPDEPEPEP